MVKVILVFCVLAFVFILWFLWPDIKEDWPYMLRERLNHKNKGKYRKNKGEHQQCPSQFN